MKKYIAIALLVLAASAFSQSTVPAGMSATIGGSAWTDDHFDNINGSFVVGLQTPVDMDRSLFGRIALHRKNFGNSPDLHYLDLSAIQYWYVGNKWSFYADPIFSVGLTEGAGNPLSIGFGFERLWLTAPASADYRVPFSLLTYTDLTFSENQTQIMFGIRITKPQK